MTDTERLSRLVAEIRRHSEHQDVMIEVYHYEAVKAGDATPSQQNAKANLLAAASKRDVLWSLLNLADVHP